MLENLEPITEVEVVEAIVAFILMLVAKLMRFFYSDVDILSFLFVWGLNHSAATSQLPDLLFKFLLL